MMREVIRDKDGNAVAQSNNLRGIRTFVGKRRGPLNLPPIVRVLDVSRVGTHDGKLCILFDDGCNYETNFASFDVLCDWVRRWRNVYGAPLTVNGSPSGEVGYRNPALIID